ncbi:MAG: hypothetical protein AAF664_02195 [Planctomycetota bacterium]
MAPLSIEWREPPRSVAATEPFRLQLSVRKSSDCLAEYLLSTSSESEPKVWHSESPPKVIERSEDWDEIEWQIRVDIPGTYEITGWSLEAFCEGDDATTRMLELPPLSLTVTSNLDPNEQKDSPPPRPIDKTVPGQAETQANKTLFILGGGLIFVAAVGSWFIRRRKRMRPIKSLQIIIDRTRNSAPKSPHDALVFLRNEVSKFVATESALNVASCTTEELEELLINVGWNEGQIRVLQQLWHTHMEAAYANANVSSSQIESLREDLDSCLNQRVERKRLEVRGQ